MAAAAHDDSQYGYSPLSIRMIHSDSHCTIINIDHKLYPTIHYVRHLDCPLVMTVVCRSTELSITLRASRPLTCEDGPIVVASPSSGTIEDLRGHVRAAVSLPATGVVTMSHGETTLDDDAIPLADAGICAETEVHFDYTPSVLIQIRSDIGQP